MRKVLFLLGTISLIMGGCRDSDNTLTNATEAKITTRPIVALVPVIDHSHSDLGWNLSQELSQTLRHYLTQKNNLYVVGEDRFPNAQKYLAWCDPFECDTAWIKKAFSQQEFVVFTELIKHSEIPLTDTKEETPAELLLTMRVSVFDLRKKEPKIVLQEMIEQTHHVPIPFTKAHHNQVPWGRDNFDVSPLGIAHATLSKEVASRLTDYILSSGL